MTRPAGLAYVSLAGDDQLVGVSLPEPGVGPDVVWSQRVDGSPGAQVFCPEVRRLYLALRASRAVAWFDLDAQGRPQAQGTLALDANPVYLSVSPDQSGLFFCSYSEDVVGYCGLVNGRPTPDVQRLKTGSHPHSVAFSPRGHLVYVPCLGEDRIRSYRWSAGVLEPAGVDVATPPASGPRHLRFHPDGNWAACVGETGNRLDLFRVDPDGRLEWHAGASTLPPLARRRGTKAGEVRFDRHSGSIYVSNRGRDSITVFEGFNQGPSFPPSLRRKGQMRTEPTPRSFDVDEPGRRLVVAGRGSGRLAFHGTGRGSRPSTSLHVGSDPTWVTVVGPPPVSPDPDLADSPPQ